MYLQFSVEWIWRLSQKKTCSYYSTSCSLGSPCMSYALFLIGLKSRGPFWTLRYLLQRPPTILHLEISPENLESKYCICVYTLCTYCVILSKFEILFCSALYYSSLSDLVLVFRDSLICNSKNKHSYSWTLVNIVREPFSK